MRKSPLVPLCERGNVTVGVTNAIELLGREEKEIPASDCRDDGEEKMEA